MPKNSLSYPKVCKHKDGRYYVNFNLNSKRYRLFNGKRINSSLAPNSYPPRLRRNKAKYSLKRFMSIYCLTIVHSPSHLTQ